MTNKNLVSQVKKEILFILKEKIENVVEVMGDVSSVLEMATDVLDDV